MLPLSFKRSGIVREDRSYLYVDISCIYNFANIYSRKVEYHFVRYVVMYLAGRKLIGASLFCIERRRDIYIVYIRKQTTFCSIVLGSTNKDGECTKNVQIENAQKMCRGETFPIYGKCRFPSKDVDFFFRLKCLKTHNNCAMHKKCAK